MTNDSRLQNYMAAAKLARILVEPVLVDDDVTLPDGTFIPAGTSLDELTPEVLDALEAYYMLWDGNINDSEISSHS